MKILHHGLWLIIIIILQSAIINDLTVFGVSANLFLVFTALIGFLCGRVQGTVCGIVFGLVYDIYVGSFIGVSALSFAVVGYFSAVLSDRFYGGPGFYVFMCLGAAAVAVNECICLIPYSVSIQNVASLGSAVRNIGINALLSAVLILPMLWLVNRTLNIFKLKNTKSFR
ncbi:MAG TPA: rod shape-determining protein MreD [Candidatus Monoglobus merdigallinarum]|uniref:Rod shape-determining protein MreD n=1 Tax=Candidatus Monoglobus merdigallinarum TaxID=2838698 RepID=A0A9D1PR02_9FIRM|nr:rod shape-determining protein MreD [Candidatus Monoglobus merdigallinarum]